MPTFTKLANEIWRAYVIDAVPASGANPPNKADVKLWGTEVENFLAGIGVIGTLVSLSADNVWTGHNTFPGNLFKFSSLAAGVLYVDASGQLSSQPVTGSLGNVVLSVSPTISNPTFTGTVNASLILVSNNTNAVTGAVVSNTSTGASATGAWGLSNGTALGNFGIASTGYTAIPLLQNRTFVNASGGAGIALFTNDAQPIILATASLFRGKVNPTGQWVVGPTNLDPANSSILFAINRNTAAPIQKPTGTVVDWIMQVQGADNERPGITIDSFGTGATNTFSVLTFRRANNTCASPSATKLGDLVGVLGGIAYAATKFSLDQWQIRYYAAQDWTDTAWGAAIAFLVTPNNSTTVFEALRIDQSGFVGIGSNAPVSLLHLNKNAVQNVSAIAGVNTLLQITGADANTVEIGIDSFGAANVAFGGIAFRNAAGTAASPTQTQASAGLGYLGAMARTNAGAYTGVKAQIQFVAAENQTASAQGQYIDVYTTPIGSTTTARAARVQASGCWSIGNTVDLGVGGLSLAGALSLAGSISPTALSGDVNDYAPTGFATAAVVRIDGGAADRNITGLAGGADGRIILIVNIGTTNNLVLVNASASSSAANRFLFNANITLAANTAQRLRYDGTSSRWRQG